MDDKINKQKTAWDDSIDILVLIIQNINKYLFQNIPKSNWRIFAREIIYKQQNWRSLKIDNGDYLRQ